MDTNKDGSISRDEFAAARKPREGAGEGRRGGEGHHGKMGAMMGRMADANKDGTVTKDEFVAAQTRRFDMVDTNKDGTISAEERQAARSSMRERMREMRAKRGAAGNQPG
jgi:Ca2+-binding EF-hand superfamily protein